MRPRREQSGHAKSEGPAGTAGGAYLLGAPKKADLFGATARRRVEPVSEQVAIEHYFGLP